METHNTAVERKPQQWSPQRPHHDDRLSRFRIGDGHRRADRLGSVVMVALDATVGECS